MTDTPFIPPHDTLWLGVHKTGTTFLQKSLDLSQAALRAGGVDYLELAEFRRRYTRPLLHMDHADDPAAVDPLLPQHHRLVLDENILALVQHALGKTSLYPDAAARAVRIADYLGLERPRIVLGLRQFRSYLPSLYCEALKATPFRRFRKFCQTPPAHLSWDDLIGRLAHAFPQSEILVYTAEALRGRESILLSCVLGLPPASFTLLSEPDRTGFSHQAIRALHALEKVRPITPADVKACTTRYPRGPGVAAFDPWTTDEAQDLEQRFAADMAKLIQRPGVRFLDPYLIATA